MAKKKKEPKKNFNPSWVVSDSIQINGRKVFTGSEISIKGERGRFRFIQLVKTPEVEWVDVIGGPNNYKAFRSFYLDRVKVVHRKNKMRENAE